MNILRTIQESTITAVANGHNGIFSNADFALMLCVDNDKKLARTLYRAVNEGILVKICRGLFYNPLCLPKSKGVLINIAKKLHWDHFIYISLESELSHTGTISQIMFDRLTVMTTGRSNVIKTVFGTIEFTHTKKSVRSLNDDLYYDPESTVFRAKKFRAISDLKRVGRNITMLEEL